MIPSFIDKAKLPQQPGVYIFKDKNGKVIYVGKAVNLYHRVASYFHTSNAVLKTEKLKERIAKAETIVVESELEALILEANLIKKHLPPFNIRLTDDEDYLYIGISKESFPKIIAARRNELRTMKKFWGPFPSARTVRDTLKLLRRVFSWCANPPKDSWGVNLPSPGSHLDSRPSDPLGWKFRPCFYYHLGLCPGPCAGVVSKTDYQKIINRFYKFMDGKKVELVTLLSEEMRKVANQRKFEEAARIKKTILGIEYLTQANRTKLYLQNPNFLEEERQLALEALKKDLNLPILPERVEGYDISNIQGKQATGSMVVLTNGEIDKSQYRKFKIRITGKPNDVGMHREMMRRRLKHPEWPLPDLIIIDGGRAQVRAVNYELKTMKYELPIFGLAKRLEWLYLPEGEVIKLPKRSLSLKLLQRLRDEAHRFAVSYHRKLRDTIILR